MRTNYVYLIPRCSAQTSKEYGAKAQDFLLRTGIISLPTDGSRCFVNGDRGWDAFEQSEADREDEVEYPFDMAEIYSGPNFKIVPDGYVDAEYCPACGATVNEQTTAALYDAEGNLLEKDFRGVQITCPECGHQFDLADSKREDAGKFYLTDRYICFVGTLPPKSDWLAKFNNDMGCNHE